MKKVDGRVYIVIAVVMLGLVLLLAARWLYISPDGMIELPPSPEITPEPAPIVYVTPSGAKYHRLECVSIVNAESLKELLPLEAVEKGYEPCLKCVPGAYR